MTAEVNFPCRRCSECLSETHHWMEECTEMEAFFGCKHCSYRCEAAPCDECEDLFPADVMRGVLCPFCDDRLRGIQ